MAFTRALYYPSIDIYNERWLKTAILYWDEINTIVPNSLEEPYTNGATRFLVEEGVIRPLRVTPDMEPVKEMAEDVFKYLQTSEGYQALCPSGHGYTIHPEKLPFEIQSMLRAHPGNLRYLLEDTIDDYWSRGRRYRVSESFGNYYLTLLANRLCDYYHLSPLTDNPNLLAFGEKSRFDILAGIGYPNYLEDHSERERFRHNHLRFAQGLLIELSFKGITISDEVAFEDILFFKREHQDELGLFRTNIENLTKDIPTDASLEQIYQYVQDTYRNRFLPEYRNLQRSLRGAGIRWIAENFLKVSFYATGTTAIPTALLGLPIKSALLAGAAVSLISSAISYNVEKREALRQNPYSYLLSLPRRW